MKICAIGLYTKEPPSGTGMKSTLRGRGEAQRAEAEGLSRGSLVLGEGTYRPSLQLGGLREHCKLKPRPPRILAHFGFFG